MTASTREPTPAALVAAAVAASSLTVAVATYALTKRHMHKKDEERRRELYERKKQIKTRRSLTLENAKKPSGILLDDVRIDEVYLWEVEHLGDRFASEAEGVVNHMLGVGTESAEVPKDRPTFLARAGLSSSDDDGEVGGKGTHYNKLIGIHECILADVVRHPGQPSHSRAYVRAGPRRSIHFDPSKVNAAIVTCGGLCPGLNNVVREITNALFHLYGLGGKVYGITGGYKGFHDPEYPLVNLTPLVVEDIHHQGGTVLSSSRGGFDLDKILDFIRKKKIKQLYVIGGDGTHRGAFRIHEGCMEVGLNVSVAGIPKTIDNDIDYIDRTFGFSSAVEAALGAIRSAKVEASCNLPNGVGIVKLMGRSAGFIAAHATISSGDVDLCLVPEVELVLEGPKGCLPFLRRRVKEKGYAVVVVAEGAGEEILGESTEVDASGNKRLPKIGEFMKAQVERHFKEHGEVATVKYIDPSYMVRSIPANAADALYCMQLAQNAVHGAMAGFTGFSVGLCNNKMVLLPIPQMVATSPRIMNPRGRTWERVLARTRQPNCVPPPKEDREEYDSHAPMLR